MEIETHAEFLSETANTIRQLARNVVRDIIEIMAIAAMGTIERNEKIRGNLSIRVAKNKGQVVEKKEDEIAHASLLWTRTSRTSLSIRFQP